MRNTRNEASVSYYTYLKNKSTKKLRQFGVILRRGLFTISVYAKPGCTALAITVVPGIIYSELYQYINSQLCKLLLSFYPIKLQFCAVI